MNVFTYVIRLLQRHITFLIVLCLLGVGIFMVLSTTHLFTPAWTYTRHSFHKGESPSLLFHDNRLWLATEKLTQIEILYSENGVRWSSFKFPEELPKYYTEFHNPCWLRRPNGDVWLLWFEKSEAPGHDGPGVYAASLGEEETLSEPWVVYPLDAERYSLCSAAIAPDGGLAVMGYHFSEGFKDQSSAYAECTIHTADENFQWDTPVSMPWLRPITDTSYVSRSTCIDICLDNQRTLWAVYSAVSPKDETRMRTSKNGTVWSDEYTIPVGIGTAFLQVQNGQYVLFFIERSRSVFMLYSSDGVKWSDPIPVTRTGSTYNLDVTQSDDGTLWAVIDAGKSLHMMKFTGAESDLSQIQDSDRKNRIITVEIVLLVGGVWIIVKRSPFYEQAKVGLKDIRLNKEKQSKVRFTEIIIGIGCFLVLSVLAPICMLLFAVFIFLTIYLVDYVLLKAENIYFTIIVIVAFVIVLGVIYVNILAVMGLL